MTTTQPNSVATCEYNKECPSHDFSKCSRLDYMSNCPQLNKYLIKTSPEERYEQIDYHTDLGLTRLLK
jgi:hypothetical protein